MPPQAIFPERALHLSRSCCCLVGAEASSSCPRLLDRAEQKGPKDDKDDKEEEEEEGWEPQTAFLGWLVQGSSLVAPGTAFWLLAVEGYLHLTLIETRVPCGRKTPRQVGKLEFSQQASGARAVGVKPARCPQVGRTWRGEERGLCFSLVPA